MIKPPFLRVLRSLLSVLFGLMVISLIAESIEFVLVAFIHGGITTDREVYFTIRNRPAMLATKFVYNGIAGFAGGYATAWVAGRTPFWHGAGLAVVQLAGFTYGATASPYANATPLWVWIVLSGTMLPAIVAGSYFRHRRNVRLTNCQPVARPPSDKGTGQCGWNSSNGIS